MFVKNTPATTPIAVRIASRFVAICLVAISAATATADITVASVFSDRMVLQRDMKVPIWGTAAPGEKVTVSFRDQSTSTVADQDGKWLVRLERLALGAPGDLTVRGKTIVKFTDVLVGDVWIGSGQSNMAGNAGGYARRDEVLAKKIADGPYPNLRLYQGSWQIASEQTIPRFSRSALFVRTGTSGEAGHSSGIDCGGRGWNAVRSLAEP